ncbi:MAG: hypothetical protein GX267_07115 [Fibrobacter sp.]|nr:hypothetical protein [Fibrobacter sp.]
MADQQSIENSPLEIYETAYRLHYIDKRIDEAIKYYEILIREFPDSNECGYAAVQIQKIKANGLIKEFKKSSRSANPVAVIALVLAVFSMLLSASASYYFYSRYKAEQNRIKLALTALSKVYIGDDDEALKVLTELKINSKDDIIPFELSSDLYKKKGLYEQARAEYEIFFRLNPALKPTGHQLSKMKLQPPPISQKPVVLEINNQSVSQMKNNSDSEQIPVSKVKPINKLPSKPKQKPVKGIFLVDPDSLNFF